MKFIEGGGLMKIMDGVKEFATTIVSIGGSLNNLVKYVKPVLSIAAGIASIFLTGGMSTIPMLLGGIAGGGLIGAGAAGIATGTVDGQPVEAKAVDTQQKEQQDFVMRPGQAPVPFSSDDTIVGFKGAMGGDNKEVVNAINALSEKVTAGIPLSATVTGHQLNLTTDTGYAGGRPGLNSGLMTK